MVCVCGQFSQTINFHGTRNKYLNGKEILCNHPSYLQTKFVGVTKEVLFPYHHQRKQQQQRLQQQSMGGMAGVPFTAQQPGGVQGQQQQQQQEMQQSQQMSGQEQNQPGRSIEQQPQQAQVKNLAMTFRYLYRRLHSYNATFLWSSKFSAQFLVVAK